MFTGYIPYILALIVSIAVIVAVVDTAYVERVAIENFSAQTVEERDHSEGIKEETGEQTVYVKSKASSGEDDQSQSEENVQSSPQNYEEGNISTLPVSDGREGYANEPKEDTPISYQTSPRTDGGGWQPLSAADCEALRSASSLYLYPETTIVKKEREYRDQGDAETADLLREISCHPQAVWLTWADAEYMKARTNMISTLAEQAGKIPIFIIYNSPSRDSPYWWVGNQGVDYINWIKSVAEGVGDRLAWFIVEPDAIGLSIDYSLNDRVYRIDELSQVVETLKQYAPNARVYLDGGHSEWKTPDFFSDFLMDAGLSKADGFVLNISNYQALDDERVRGRAISALTGGKHFIIDTSRNGKGAPGDQQWCNARGRSLGEKPTVDTGEELIDAYLWVKPPGESDGVCNGGPTPGKFWLEYALELVRNTI